MIPIARSLLVPLLLLPLQGLQAQAAGPAADASEGVSETSPGAGSEESTKSSEASDEKKSSADSSGQAADPQAAKPAAPDCPKSPVDALETRLATEAAVAYLEALKAQGLGAAPEHLHPEALEAFKSGMLPALEAEQVRGGRALLNATFGRDANIADARGAAPEVFMSRFARLMSARQPDAAPTFGGLTPLGVLPEGDRLHVLLRLAADGSGAGVERLEVVSVLPFGSGYKVLLDDRLSAMVSALAGRSSGTDRRAGLPLAEPVPEGLPLPPLAPVAPSPVAPSPGTPAEPLPGVR
jgi:hypothetical protein